MRVTFVCWGNICRSTMAEQIGKAWAARDGIPVEFDSAGVSSEERGNPIDRRAAATLRTHGYDAGDHRAKHADRELIDSSDLVLGFEPVHVRMLHRMAPEAENIRLVTEFDPDATSQSIEDPWYGGQQEFEETLAAVEAAMPGIFDEIARIRS